MNLYHVESILINCMSMSQLLDIVIAKQCLCFGIAYRTIPYLQVAIDAQWVSLH